MHSWSQSQQSRHLDNYGPIRTSFMNLGLRLLLAMRCSVCYPPGPSAKSHIPITDFSGLGHALDHSLVASMEMPSTVSNPVLCAEPIGNTLNTKVSHCSWGAPSRVGHVGDHRIATNSTRYRGRGRRAKPTLHRRGRPSPSEHP